MVRLNDIIENLLSYNPKADTRPIEKAYVYSAKVHQGQVRLSGLPYLSHPLEVAYILTKMKMDVTTITAGILHDTLEDTQATLEELVELFGQAVANIVDGVTKISKMKFATHEERQSENMKKIILAMANDIRVIIVKLADRLHNMQTLGYHSPEKQKIIAKETLDIYAPIAGRLGIYWMKSLLEDLCLYYLEPEIYKKIKQDIAERKGYREKFIKDVIILLEKKLKEAGIDATIKGRHKHFYSIYRKMKEQNLSVNEVYDIIGFRVIVNNVKECYETLGLVHSMWPPIPGRIKDYISMPKENLYQSLHTTVIGPLGQRMEIQIRTWEMDRIAEEGIAAHWKYKEGKGSTETDEEYFKWLRQLLEWQRDLKDPKEFLESVKLELYPNDVYVFTPKGEVKKLPRGSTPVDFAYSIHSEIGDRCIQAKVNNRPVPLDYRLRNGDIVEIITSPKQHPRRDWLDFVKSSRAKAKIRQWIRKQEKEESISIGRELIEKELEHAKIQINNIMESDQMRQVAEEFSFASVQDLFANVGWGKISAKQVIGRLRPKIQKEGIRSGILDKVVSRFKKRRTTHGIKVKGVENVLIRFANCCNPIPGEDVIGYITRGRGVTIHRRDCRHIVDAEKERLVDLIWEPSDEDLYQVRLRVTSKDKKGILAEISSIISKKNANILEADIKTTPDKKGISVFTLEVEDYHQLQDIMSSIKKIKDILIVERI